MKPSASIVRALKALPATTRFADLMFTRDDLCDAARAASVAANRQAEALLGEHGDIVTHENNARDAGLDEQMVGFWPAVVASIECADDLGTI
jgi:hypothetical protein